MITCYLQYEIEPRKLAEFEAYAKSWIALVDRFGGKHHGYLLPHEGPSDFATASFSFESLAEYERYREKIKTDEQCQRVFAFARETGCIRRHVRYFMRPVLEGDLNAVQTFDGSS
jgi:hypothetical protein